LFIDDVQAYNGGKGHSFWILNNLRNIDKHRLLVTVAQIAGVSASFKDAKGGTYSGNFAVSAGQGTMLIDAPFDYVQFIEEPRPSFQIEINEPPYIKGVPVLDFLNGVTSETKALLDTLKV
jgi:hypothetical protein